LHSAADDLVCKAMKDAIKCDKSCDMYSVVSHRISECKVFSIPEILKLRAIVYVF